MKTANVEISTKNPKFGEVKGTFAVPQVESFEEAATFFNGADKALDFLNNAIGTNAGNGARAVLRSEKFETIEACLEKATAVAAEYSPQTSAAGTSVKAKAAKLDSLAAALEQGKEFTKEELLALIASAK